MNATLYIKGARIYVRMSEDEFDILYDRFIEQSEKVLKINSLTGSCIAVRPCQIDAILT